MEYLVKNLLNHLNLKIILMYNSKANQLYMFLDLNYHYYKYLLLQ